MTVIVTVIVIVLVGLARRGAPSRLGVLVVVVALVELVEALHLDRVRRGHRLEPGRVEARDHGGLVGAEPGGPAGRIGAPRRPGLGIEHQVGHGALSADDVGQPGIPNPPNPTLFMGGQAQPPPMPAPMLNLPAMNDWKLACTGSLAR